MSVEYCNMCDNFIDTDYNVEGSYETKQKPGEYVCGNCIENFTRFCTVCDGRGTIPCYVCEGTQFTKCDACGDSGIEYECPKCGGNY